MAPSLLVVAGVPVGWVLGAPLAVVARRLGAGSGSPAPRLLVLDPWLQGFQAIVLGALAWHFGLSAQLAVYAALSLVLTLVLFVDMRTHLVYGIVAYPGILAGVVLTPVARGGFLWEGLASAAVGATIFGVLYLLGRALYRGGEPLASGDVIIGALVGSVVGLGQVLPAALCGILLSGAIALIFAARWRSLAVYMPYGPGLCLGALVVLLR